MTFDFGFVFASFSGEIDSHVSVSLVGNEMRAEDTGGALTVPVHVLVSPRYGIQRIIRSSFLNL